MSAVVLRELVAKLGFQVDEQAFQRADDGVNKVKKDLEQLDRRMRDSGGRFKRTGKDLAAGTQAAAEKSRKAASRDAKGGSIGGSLSSELGKWLTGAAVTAGVAQMLELASSADETNNVLREVFGPAGEEQVHQWADTTAKEVGRSKYALEASAGALGAMLGPLTGNAEQAQIMSTRFAKLAVDLGSFFNASDEDALAALKSGITGEAEPLKRFGVVMNEATLAEYAHSQGITAKLQAMTNAQKTTLRYNYILSQTTKADGDAARTSDGFANMLKRVQARFRDLTTDIGRRFLPTAERVLKWLVSALDEFERLTKETNVLTAAIIVLGAALALAFAGPLASMLLMLTVFAALILLVEDLVTWFKGGRSAFGIFLEKLLGIEDAKKALDAAHKAVDGLRESWTHLIAALENGGFEAAIDRVTDKLNEFILLLRVAPKALLLGFDKYLVPGRQQTEAQDEDETEKLRVELYNARKRNRPRIARIEFLKAQIAAENAAAADAAKQQELESNPSSAFIVANPNQTYANPALQSDVRTLPAQTQTPVMVQPGNLTINNYLPPNANVKDYVREQQNADAISRRRASDAVRKTAP